MILLGLDTSGAQCAAALVSDDEVLAEQCHMIGRGHAEHLAPMVADILTKTGLAIRDIDRIAVTTGPGSFTGLRVGLSFAKGLSLPRDTEVIGLSVPRVLAAGADQDQSQNILSVVNVRRNELCWAYYEKGVELCPPLTEPISWVAKSVKNLPFDKMVGDGVELLEGQLKKKSGMDQKIINASPVVLAKMARFYDAKDHPPIPLYARGPDAKLPGGRSLKTLLKMK